MCVCYIGDGKRCCIVEVIGQVCICYGLDSMSYAQVVFCNISFKSQCFGLMRCCNFGDSIGVGLFMVGVSFSSKARFWLFVILTIESQLLCDRVCWWLILFWRMNMGVDKFGNYVVIMRIGLF